MLIQTTDVLTAVLFTSCFRLSWLSSYFPARSLKQLMNAWKLVCAEVGAVGGAEFIQGKRTGMKAKRIHRESS